MAQLQAQSGDLEDWFKRHACSYFSPQIPQGQPVAASVAFTFISMDRKGAEDRELALQSGESPGLLGGCPTGARAARFPVPC